MHDLLLKVTRFAELRGFTNLKALDLIEQMSIRYNRVGHLHRKMVFLKFFSKWIEVYMQQQRTHDIPSLDLNSVLPVNMKFDPDEGRISGELVLNLPS